MSRTARTPVLSGWRRTTAMFVAATVLLAPVAVSSSASATAATDRGPTLTHLVHFGSGLGSGSTIGPDGALYVTDGTAGSVKRVDRHTGAVSVYATGLPPRVLGIGGAMDVAFLAGHGYALVTMVGGDFVGGPHIGDAVVGIYRLDSGGHPTADRRHRRLVHRAPTERLPPHHRRAVRARAVPRWVPRHRRAPQPDAPGHSRGRDHRGRDLRQRGSHGARGSGQPGLGHAGRPGPPRRRGRTGPRAGPALRAAGRRDGRPPVVDVELGPQHQLYALSQGVWNGVAEGSPALPNTGRLTRVTPAGGLEPVTDSAGHELVLDRPTSVELVGRTAYVVSLSGDVYTIDGL